MSEPTTEPGLEPATTRADRAETEVGSVFVSNYPAYSFWGEADLPKAENNDKEVDGTLPSPIPAENESTNG